MSFNPREKTAQEHVDDGTFNPAIYLDQNVDLRNYYETSNPYTAGDLANATAHFLANGYGEFDRPVFPAGHIYEFGHDCFNISVENLTPVVQQTSYDSSSPADAVGVIMYTDHNARGNSGTIPTEKVANLVLFSAGNLTISGPNVFMTHFAPNFSYVIGYHSGGFLPWYDEPHIPLWGTNPWASADSLPFPSWSFSANFPPHTSVFGLAKDGDTQMFKAVRPLREDLAGNWPPETTKSFTLAEGGIDAGGLYGMAEAMGWPSWGNQVFFAAQLGMFQPQLIGEDFTGGGQYTTSVGHPTGLDIEAGTYTYFYENNQFKAGNFLGNATVQGPTTLMTFAFVYAISDEEANSLSAG